MSGITKESSHLRSLLRFAAPQLNVILQGDFPKMRFLISITFLLLLISAPCAAQSKISNEELISRAFSFAKETQKKGSLLTPCEKKALSYSTPPTTVDKYGFGVTIKRDSPTEEVTFRHDGCAYDAPGCKVTVVFDAIGKPREVKTRHDPCAWELLN